jgi:CUB domain/Divergent InlB B-repeat domain/Secretion system C-terminal sorting domain/Fibronectin type III domain
MKNVSGTQRTQPLLIWGMVLLTYLAISEPALAQQSHQPTWQELKLAGANYQDIKAAFTRRNQSRLRRSIRELKREAGSSKRKSGNSERELEEIAHFSRWAHFAEPRVAESNGNLAAIEDGTARALAQQQQSLQSRAANWQQMGPLNTPTSGGNGRVNSLLVHPTNPNFLFACTPGGGLWKSVNGGTSWTATSDAIAVLGASDLVFDPTNPDILYLLTGDGDGGDTRFTGIYKSVDGGTNWAVVGLSQSAGNGWVMSRLLIHPTNNQILLAAGNAGIYRSMNGGTTWAQVSTINTKDLEWQPNNPNVVYAGSRSSNSDPSAGVWRSVNGGVTWSKLAHPNLPTSNSQRVAIAVTPHDAQYVYALFSLNVTGNANSGFKGLYRSNDGGTSWTQQATTPNLLGWNTDGGDLGGQGWYDLSLAVSPTNKTLVTVGGVNIWQSTNEGVNWTCKSHWYGANNVPYVHADQHLLTYSGSTLYAANDGGVFKSTNNGTTWTDISSNLAIAQLYGLGLSASNPNVIISGHQDNGTNLTTNGTSWREVYGGDGMLCFIDYTNNNQLFASLYYGGLFRSTNAGNGFSKVYDVPNGGWVTPWLQDPVTPTTLYAAGSEVHKSTNSGTSWTPISAFGGTTSFASMDVAKTNPLHILAATYNTVRKTTNGGTSWTTLSGLPTGGILKVYFDVNSENIIYVGVASYQGNSVWRSTDGGATWANWGTGLPNMPVSCFVSQTGTDGTVYCGTDIGVYYRNNTLNAWQAFTQGMPGIRVTDLEIYYPTQKLRAATYGRGIWESDLETVVNGFVIQASVSPANSGNLSGVGIFQAGASVTLTATPSIGYTFSNWTENATIVSTNAVYTFTATANRTLVANFVTAPICGNAVLTTCNGTITDGSGENDYLDNTNCSWLIQPSTPSPITLTFTALDVESNYDFVRVYDGSTTNHPLLGEFTGNSLPNAVTSTAGSMLVVFTSDEFVSGLGWAANYSCTTNANWTITTHSTPPNGGTTSGDGSYATGNSVTVLATPAAGYTFVKWLENNTLVSNNASYTFAATANRDLTAVFIQDGLRPFPDGLPTCLEDDFRVLESLYNATNGDFWFNNTNWFTSPNLRSWYGVQLTTDGCAVSSLLLNQNNLSTTLPSVAALISNEIFNLELPELLYFRADSNVLRGGLPTFACPKLQLLDLRYNQLTGTIPDYNLPQLKLLGLGSNQLTGSIPHFTNLPLLERLWIERNQLSGTLPNLTAPQLIDFIAWKNQLTGSIPNFNMPNLKILSLSENQLTGSIPNFNMPVLEYLFVRNNQLTGSIPNFNMPKLIEFTAATNQLSGALPNFNMPFLVGLYAGENQLTGNLPNLALPNLKYLDLGTNQLIGTIPNFALPKLEFLNLTVNQLSGTIPNFAYPNLKKLYLSVNRLTGSIPNFNLPSVDTLFIRHNLLTGTIPNFNLPNLVALSLRNNQLTGAIPDFNLPKLKMFRVDTNRLTGNVPNFSRCAFLTATDPLFYLNDNQFTFGHLEGKPWLAIADLRYAPQAKIPITLNNGLLTVNTGAANAVQQFSWYKDGVLITTNQSNTFQTTMSGTYYCVITHQVLSASNELAKQLILQSEDKVIAACNAPATTVSLITYVSARINWALATGVSGYEIRYRPVGGTWTTVTAAGNATFVNVANLTAGTDYQYEILLKCTPSSVSAYSETRSFATLTCRSNDFTVIGSTTTPSTLKVSWVLVPGALGYEVSYKLANAATYIVRPLLGATVTTTNLTGLAANTVYEVRVRVKCTATTFATETIKQATTGCPKIVAAPTVSHIGSKSAHIKWVNVGNVLNYKLQWKKTLSTTWNESALVYRSVYLGDVLEPSTSYQVRVVAICDVTNNIMGEPSLITAFTTLSNVCVETTEPNNTAVTPRPFSLAASIRAKISNGIDQDWFKLTTTGRTHVFLSDLTTNYNLYIYNSTGTQLLFSSEREGNLLESLQIEAGTYLVMVKSAAGAFDPINCYNLAATLATSLPTSALEIANRIQDFNNENSDNSLTINQLLVAPNPTTGFLNLYIESTEAGTSELTVSDALGKVVMTTPEVSLTVGKQVKTMDLTGLVDGFYLIRWVRGDFQSTQKVFLKK